MQLTGSSTRGDRSTAGGWWISGLLLLATMINYMDRQTLSNLIPRITQEWNLSNEQYGDMEFVFGIAFAVGSLVFGFAADKVSVRWLYPAILVAWSAVGFATGLTLGYESMLVCRGLLGFFESGHWPCALIVTQAVMSKSDRVMGNSILQSGASAGAVLTPLVIRLMVGDAIYTRFTPLTFSKPQYNGLRLDLANSQHSATLLLSRPSDPNGPYQNDVGLINSGNGTHATHLVAGHADLALGAWARLGLSYVNVHTAHTQNELNNGNPLNGTLTLRQNQPLRTFWVRLRDDSPQDLQGGATLLAHDIVLTDTSGQRLRGSEIGFLPQVEGGISEGGALVADGNEQILLKYDLDALDYEELTAGALRSVQVALDVADDYRIETASNLQTDGVSGSSNPVFLTQARAAGNVQDRSNTGLRTLSYGLPVASEIYGFNWNMPDWHGLSAQGEMAVNRRLQRYPNPSLKRHHQTAKTAAASYGQFAYRRYPFALSVELFSMDDDYSTSYWLTTPSGSLIYDADIPQVYELVDDDDDLNAIPEWLRPYQPSNGEIAWPGYDENGDFLNDHNANANLIPDYEEPFLRFRSDRPQLLAGLDMNHNGTVDRFENDEEADFPYRRDRRGYNVYGGIFLWPDVRLTVGRQHLREIADDGHSKADYAILTADHAFSWARLRFFGDVRRVKDDIEDDLLQWVQLPNSRGELLPRRDPLPARNAVVSTTWLGLNLTRFSALKLRNIAKWQWYHQRDESVQLRLRGQRREGYFFGIINKAEYRVQLGRLTLIPAWKSEFRRESPIDRRTPRRLELSEIFILMSRLPVFLSSYIEGGIEHHRFSQLRDPTPPGYEDSFHETTLVGQLTNISDYQGYRLTTVLGFDMTRRYFEVEGTRTRTRGFLTVYAGVER